MQKFASEDKVRKKCFIVNFMVKPLKFSEGDGSKITGKIKIFFRGLTTISTFQITHLIRRKLPNLNK